MQTGTGKLKDKEKSRRAKRSRRKGHDFERHIVREIQKRLGPDWIVRRGLQSRGGGESPDVGIYSLHTNRPHVHIECKHGKRVNIQQAIGQARRDKDPHALPIAITRTDRQDILVTMAFDDWLDWLIRIYREDSNG